MVETVGAKNKMSNVLLRFSVNVAENKKRYADYLVMNDCEKKIFEKEQVQETGLSPEQMFSIISAPTIPASSMAGNRQKRVYLRDIYEVIYKNDIKANSVPLASLSCLDSPFLTEAWGDVDDGTGETHPLTLRNLASNHLRRIIEADLNFPIITIKRKTVLDGWHRVAKACYLGYPAILAFDISEKFWERIPSVFELHLK